MRQKDRKLPARKMIQELLVAATAERKRLEDAVEMSPNDEMLYMEAGISIGRVHAFQEALDCFTDLPS